MQSSAKVVIVDKAPLDSLPDGGLSPFHPPDAVHEAVSVLVQLSETLPPGCVRLGLAVSETVGGCAEPATVTVTVCESVPPAPLQVNV
jgi:hypothetical protein